MVWLHGGSSAGQQRDPHFVYEPFGGIGVADSSCWRHQQSGHDVSADSRGINRRPSRSETGNLSFLRDRDGILFSDCVRTVLGKRGQRSGDRGSGISCGFESAVECFVVSDSRRHSASARTGNVSRDHAVFLLSAECGCFLPAGSGAEIHFVD